jgi:quercetin dioxygenase-like cupin family protein
MAPPCRVRVAAPGETKVGFRASARYCTPVQAWNLLELEAPEGIRSPSVLHSADARAIALRLLPGQALGDHRVRERAWLTVVEGEVEVTCGDERATVAAGALVMFDPGEMHSVTSPGGARLLLLLAPWPASGHYASGEESQQAS